jgi:hypothetical protein
MMRRSLLAAAVLVLALLAQPATAGSADRVLPWGLDDCRFVIALVPTSAARIAAHLPDGFVPVVPDSVRALLPPDARLEAVFGLEVFDCASGAGLGGPVDGLDYGSFWSFVQAPAALADDRYQLAFYKWDTLVPDDDRRTLLAEAGALVRDGEAALDRFVATPPGTVLDARLVLDGSQSFRFAGATAAPVDFTGTFIEYQQGDDGFVAWRTAYRSDAAHGGAGLVEFAPASFPTVVLGEPRAQAYLLAGTGPVRRGDHPPARGRRELSARPR